MKQRDRIKQQVTSAHPVDRHIGQQIKIRRRQLHMSQNDLGGGIGLSCQQVQKYENGTNRVSASMLYEIAGCLNVSVAKFFEGLPEPGSGDVNHAASNIEERIAYILTGEGRQLIDSILQLPRPVRRRIRSLVGALMGEVEQ